jgi:hypothetical protein
MLGWAPLATPSTTTSRTDFSNPVRLSQGMYHSLSESPEPRTGTLNSVLIEHFGSSAAVQPYTIARTDTTHQPSSEAFSPMGSQGNRYSADCSGGYFLVGVSGLTDFGSSQGTISLWIKWDSSLASGRFWGQDYNFETRWSGDNRLTLDWGGDNTIIGNKNDWALGRWYFLAITWDDTSNQIAIYWGNEDTTPLEDTSTSSWLGSVVGLLSENDLMNSAGRTNTMVDGHVDDFRYYTVERSLEDIGSDYLETLTGSEPGLSHYYKFEGSLSDSSGSADLIPVGASSFSYDVCAGKDPWSAEQVEVDIRDLNRLYALNGTFETGNPGANIDWIGDGAFHADGWLARREVLYSPGRQRTSYVDTGRKYISIENEGYEVVGVGYRHYDGTRIYWYQMVNNSQGEEEFEFSMDYLYQRGPIGLNYSGIFEFGFEILNGTSVLWNWTIDPTNMTQRGVWFSTGPLEVTIPEAPPQFEIRVFLEVDTPSMYVQIDENDADLDGDSANGQFLTFFVDDMSLTALNAPSPKHVELVVDCSPVGSFPVLGTASQGVILLNYSFWKKASIPFTFSSNTTVSFEFSSKVSFMTRFSDSMNSMNLEDDGVSYSIEMGESAEFSLYTYIQSYPEAADKGIIAHIPSDWNNPQVLNPLGHDVTPSVSVEASKLTVPSGLANSAGWWTIVLHGPNYVNGLTTQVQNSSDLTWADESIFHNDDRIRCFANVGTTSGSVGNVTNVEVSWYLPSGDLWANEALHNFNGSIVTTHGEVFGPVNSTVGEWLVGAFWSNGTEVGYGKAEFRLLHKFTVIALTPTREIKVGEEFTLAIYLYDQDNGNSILSDAQVTGNWTSGIVQFSPNYAKNWWEADFNSTNFSSGEYLVVIEVAMPYFESSSTNVTIRIPGAESLYVATLKAGFIGAFIVIISVVAIAFSRRFYMTTMTRRNVELLALEGRIDDAKNLIGLLVIHRAIGLPVYSNILKGAFQESILSSLITAISQFRSEFSIDEPMWTAIPITEVVTAVQTESLICAIITVEPASSRQKVQLETFSREVGGLYDHQDDAIRQMVRSPTLSDTFDTIFFSYFDGRLMKRYVGVKRNLPKDLSPVSSALDTMDIHHGVSVDAIIKATSVLGYTERRAHQMVLEAVDGDFLIAAETGLPPPLSSEE